MKLLLLVLVIRFIIKWSETPNAKNATTKGNSNTSMHPAEFSLR